MISSFHHDEDGLTLVELLVVLVVLGIVGTIALTGIMNGIRTTTRAQDRIDALTQLQQGVERIGRELRAACLVNTFDDDDVSVNVVRDGQVHRYRYVLGSVLGAGSEDELYEVYSVRDPSNGNFDVQSTSVFIRDLDSTDPLFAYLDPHGSPAGVATDVSTAEIRLRRDLPNQQNPIEVRTSVHLRNHGGFACGT